MKILAFDFSSPRRSVAVLDHRRDESHGSPIPQTQGGLETRKTRPAEVLAFEVIESAPGKTMRPLGMVENALQQAGLEREQIECIAVGLGPGSYTGIRAAIALAQGWQLGRPVKLLGLSSADAVAAQAQAEGGRGPVSVVIDAQRGEFYLAGYELEDTRARAVAPLRIVTREEIAARTGETLIGPEVTRWFPTGQIMFPRAARLAHMAVKRSDYLPGEKLEPIYLRETTFVKAPPPRVLPEL